MDVDENCQRREGKLFRAEICEDARADEKSNVGGHCGESRESRGNGANSETIQVRRE